MISLVFILQSVIGGICCGLLHGVTFTIWLRNKNSMSTTPLSATQVIARSMASSVIRFTLVASGYLFFIAFFEISPVILALSGSLTYWSVIFYFTRERS